MKTGVFLSFIIFSLVLSFASAVNFRPQPVQLQATEMENADALPSELKELLQKKVEAKKSKIKTLRTDRQYYGAFDAVTVQEIPDCQYVRTCWLNRGRVVCGNVEVC